VSPRAQLVPLIIGNTAFLSIAYSNTDKYAEKYERYAIQNRTAPHIRTIRILGVMLIAQ